MNATFNIKVSIDSSKVSTSLGSEKIVDMDTTLLAAILKVFGDVQNRVKAQVSKFYGSQKEQPENMPASEEEPIAVEGGAADNMTE